MRDDEEERYLLDEGYLPAPTREDIAEAHRAPLTRAPRWLLVAVDEHVEVAVAYADTDDAAALDQVDALLARLL